MSMVVSDALGEALLELRSVFPEMRFGQLLLNLASSAGIEELPDIWEMDDQTLLAAAQRLLAHHRERNPHPHTIREADLLTP